jgi:F-type H+-transporting ATPase subunit alpha
MELLKQGQYAPFAMEEQVVSMWVGTSGRLDDVPTSDVSRFERELLDFLKREHAGILDGIRESRKFDDDTDSTLSDAFDQFLKQFETSDGKPIKAGREEAEALADEDVEQEQIVRQKRG